MKVRVAISMPTAIKSDVHIKSVVVDTNYEVGSKEYRKDCVVKARMLEPRGRVISFYPLG